MAHIQSRDPNEPGVFYGWNSVDEIPLHHVRLTDEEIEARLSALVAPTVPFAITRRQARLALLQAGKLAAVESAIAGIADPTERMAAQIEYEAETWERANPWMERIGTVVGLTPADIDQLFITAATL